MTNEQIIKLMKEAKVPNFVSGRDANREVMLKFGHLVCNATIEECAAKCDAWGNASSVTYLGSATKAAAQRLREMKK